ncbi:hypothetical protein BGZ98_007237 [Dissophora globulifera]|nr:hypothetical protein BGZ98_007237 [Dissophora globulifera]
MSDGFTTRKKIILVALNSDTPDKSPKGYVDEPLLPLIVLINSHSDYVTTSSCSGRICTYLEGVDESAAAPLPEDPQIDSSNGEDDSQVARGYEENTSLVAVEAAKRAKGGQWLYVSHDPVEFPTANPQDPNDQQWIVETLFGPEAHRVVLMEDSHNSNSTLDMARSQLIYFKFEPMAATPAAAKTFLNHSLFSGYRNSGILPSAKRTMLAIRSTLKLDAPIAYITTPIPTASSTSPASSSSSSPPELASVSTSISTRASASSKQPLTEEPKIHLMVSLTYLRVLLELSNDKFRMNVAQMGRFESRLKEYLVDNNNNNDNDSGTSKTGDQGAWEDKDARKERKRREGLLKQQQAQEHKAKAEASQEAAEAATQPETTAALHQ